MQFTPKMMPLAGALVLAFATSAQAQEIVKIGTVGPLSGPGAPFGKESENAIRMALDEINAKNPTIGGKPVKFTLQSEDDMAEPKQATTAAQKLVDDKVVGVIGHLNSGTTIPAAKVYADAGIPQISEAATNPKYTQQGFKTAFRLVTTDNQAGGTLGRYAVEKLGAKKIAVIDDRTAYGQGLADEFTKSAKASGATIVDRQYTSDKSTDVAAQLTSIKAKNPDLIFFGGMGPVTVSLLSQSRALGMTARIMGGDGICADILAQYAGDAIGEPGHVVCAQPGGIEESQKKGMDDFRAAYQKKFGTAVQAFAPYSYDAAYVLTNAMIKAGSSDPAKYLPVLAKTSGYKGVTGTISFDAHGDIKNAALTIFTFKGGHLDPLAVTR
jgi:branched-chain amino acid transport system substrate-binding protein